MSDTASAVGSILTCRFGPESTAGFTGVPTSFRYNQTSSVRLNVNRSLMKMDKLSTGAVRTKRLFRLLKKMSIAFTDSDIDEAIERFTFPLGSLPSVIPPVPEADLETNPWLNWEAFLDGVDVRLSPTGRHTLILLDPEANDVRGEETFTTAPEPRPQSRTRGRLQYTCLDTSRIPIALQHGRPGDATFDEKSTKHFIGAKGEVLPPLTDDDLPGITEDPQYVKATTHGPKVNNNSFLHVRKKNDSEQTQRAMGNTAEPAPDGLALNNERLKSLFHPHDPSETGKVSVGAFRAVINRHIGRFPRHVIDEAKPVNGFIDYISVCRRGSGLEPIEIGKNFPRDEPGRLETLLTHRDAPGKTKQGWYNDNIKPHDMHSGKKFFNVGRPATPAPVRQGRVGSTDSTHPPHPAGGYVY